MEGEDLERAVGLLGPLEGRIMRLVWTGTIGEPSAAFTVRDMQALLPGLAYTTVMTTLRRLADKGLLVAEATVGRRAYSYRAAGGPGRFLAEASARETRAFVDRYGEAALAAFAVHLDSLTPAERRRLEELAKRQ